MSKKNDDLLIEYKNISDWLAYSDDFDILKMKKIVVDLGFFAYIPVTPPIIGSLLAIGYFEKIIEHDWTSKMFANWFIKGLEYLT